MEVIHLILGKANPDQMDVVSMVVYQLATQQAASGRDVAVWGITKDLNTNYDESNFSTQLFQAYRNPFKLDNKLKESLLEKKSTATFHLHGGWVPIYSTVSKFLAKHNISFVITAHGSYNAVAMERNAFVKKIYFRFCEKELLMNAKRIHVLSESEMEGLNKIFPNIKSFHLPYGFEAPQTFIAERAKGTDFIIGFVGQLDVYNKGLDLLITAFEKFNNLKPNSKLLIIGDGEERLELIRMISELNLQENIIMHEGKFGEEKNQLISEMTIFAYPSRNEGLPVSVLEACNMKVPAVVTHATNIASYVEKYNAGIAVANDDSLALALAFLELNMSWEYNELDAIKQNAKTMVAEAFNWDSIINEFDNLYL